jgi:hypothetical protein
MALVMHQHTRRNALERTRRQAMHILEFSRPDCQLFAQQDGTFSRVSRRRALVLLEDPKADEIKFGLRRERLNQEWRRTGAMQCLHLHV